jgi:hypothetical protein
MHNLLHVNNIYSQRLKIIHLNEFNKESINSSSKAKRLVKSSERCYI